MITVLKIISLPFIFILPWLWIQVSNREILIQQILVNQPLLAAILLLPGLVVFLVWIVRRILR